MNKSAANVQRTVSPNLPQKKVEQKSGVVRPANEKVKKIMSIADIPISELQRLAAKAHNDGNYAQAKSFYICLIAVIKLKDGPKSNRLAVNFYQLAKVYADEGNYAGAQTLYERAIEIWNQSNPGDAETTYRLSEAMGRLEQLSELEIGRNIRADRKAKSDRQDVA